MLGLVPQVLTGLQKVFELKLRGDDDKDSHGRYISSIGLTQIAWNAVLPLALEEASFIQVDLESQ